MRIRRRPGWVLVAAIVAASLSATLAVAQQDIFVDDDCTGSGNGSPGDPYCTIQEAICFLKDNGGGTVQVNPGTYTEAVRMFPGVSVVAVSGPADTIIDATGQACITSACVESTVIPCSVVYFPTDSATNSERIEGFTLTGGGGIHQTCSGNCDVQAGGAIFVLNSSPTITNNIIINNTLENTPEALFGGGLYIHANPTGGRPPSMPVITQNVIENNVNISQAGQNQNSPRFSLGGAMYVGYHAVPTISDNIIRGNFAGDLETAHQLAGGGGIALYTGAVAGTPVITRNVIEDNLAGKYGGGISANYADYYTPGTALIENNIFDGNTAPDGGNLAVRWNAGTIRNNTFFDGLANWGGGVSTGYPGSPPAQVNLFNNLFVLNYSYIAGGGLYVYQADPVVQYNDLHGNTPDNVGGDRAEVDYIDIDGNVSVDPLFVNPDPLGPDLHLRDDSPVIDVGDDTDAGPMDLDGAPRIQDGEYDGTPAVDMGAYEFSPDWDGDTLPDWLDPDDDNDGVDDGADCHILGRGVSSSPGPVGNTLLLDKDAGTLLKWNRGGEGHVSNVYRGTLTIGEIFSYNEICLFADVPGTEITDTEDPLAGTMYYYLVGARNICGDSRIGVDGSDIDILPLSACAPMSNDTDTDGLDDVEDNCPETINADQSDTDLDFVGDLCDNCMDDPNPTQGDFDGDTYGDLCDNCPLQDNGTQTDNDSDGHGNACDNCPDDPNTDQLDTDLDGMGDVCDPDDDNDNVIDENDNCPLVENQDQTNTDLDTFGDACDDDDDDDTILDTVDNCPLVANLDQTDTDGDGIGDACDQDEDTDGDTIPDSVDNCPLVPNTDQTDTDGDLAGDVCDDDDDDDTVLDGNDNCPLVANTDQTDTDGDLAGDVCDDDDDDDTVLDGNDNCPLVANTDQTDTDGDLAGDVCDDDDDDDTVLDGNDNCPLVANTDQTDTDGDSAGDVCDDDDDDDTVLDTADNCPLVANTDQTDTDGDLAGDVCDDDDDDDTVLDGNDNCPLVANTDQTDTDGDLAGDVCDDDDDDDTVLDGNDNCPLVANTDQTDTDGDSAGDVCDDDDDDDTVLDTADNCPLVANTDQTDTDGDLAGDVCDDDDDDDTVLDTADNCPLVANTDQTDTDGDSAGDVCDDDDDDDTVLDGNDNCPLVANTDQTDTDGDLAGDVCDDDDDDDTVLDTVDNCPLVANTDQTDTDGDLAGDVCDDDDDDDGVTDLEDCAPLDASAAFLPDNVSALAVSPGVVTNLTWTDLGPGVIYDVAGGLLSVLQFDAGPSSAECLENDASGASWDDTRPNPVSGEGFYFFVRGQNVCGVGPYGTDSEGIPREPVAACP